MATKKEIKSKTKLSAKVINEAEGIISELNDKQRAFCREYCMHWNGMKAYMKAYTDSNEISAAVCASRLLVNVKIQEYIKHLKNNIEEHVGISKAMIVEEHYKLAFSSIAHLHETWIERKEFNLLSDSEKCCIQEISTSIRTVFDQVQQKPIEVEFVKIKLYSKQASLDSISKLMGYNATEKVEGKFNIEGKINITYK